MMNAPYEKEFVFHDGRRAKNIRELLLIIESMQIGDFEKFVNSYKNDFANWLEHVFLEKELAAALRSTSSMEKTKDILESKLSELEGRQIANVNTNSKHFSPSSFSFGLFKNTKKEHSSDSLKNSLTDSVAKNIRENESTHNFKTVNGFETHTVSIKSPSSENSHQTVAHKVMNTPIHQVSTVDSSDSLSDLSQESRESSKGESSKGFSRESTHQLLHEHLSTEPKRKWYHFSRKKNVSHDDTKKELKKEIENVHHDHHEHSNSQSGNVAWIIIYGLLILLIVGLVVYKFVFQ